MAMLFSTDKAIDISPKNADFHYDKGLALANLEKYGDALVSYDIAIELDPNNADFHYDKGLALANLEKYGDAILTLIKPSL